MSYSFPFFLNSTCPETALVANFKFYKIYLTIDRLKWNIKKENRLCYC